MKCVVAYSDYWQNHPTDKPQRTSRSGGHDFHWWPEHKINASPTMFPTDYCVRCGQPLRFFDRTAILDQIIRETEG